MADVNIYELEKLGVDELEKAIGDMSESELKELQRQLQGAGVIGEGQTGTSMDGYPSPPDKESVYKFFKHLIELKDSSKVANLSNPELGRLDVSVRGFQDMALYSEFEGLPKVGEMLRAEGEIVLATSLSKKGFLPQLFVTQIKKERKDLPQDKLKVSSKGFLGLGGGSKVEVAESE